MAGLLVGAGLLFACGPASKPTPLNSGVNQDKIVSDLTSAEAEQLCRSGAATITSRMSNDELCRLSAATTAILLSDTYDVLTVCEEVMLDCTGGDFGEDLDDDCGSVEAPACYVRVSEVETCYSDSVSAMKKGVASVGSCGELVVLVDDLGAEGALSVVMGAEPTSCKRLPTECQTVGL